ncbi:hypothetical protein [Hyphomicrobium sp.]|uniref:hypothetical protein n=1 Tax=Hyphomicrobium sp. TaxID=82 RepID=UPI0025B940A4|nr:hypothetical protein [Hyphomicrobium sp.]MCC7253506.1 hypothetical protein [Hyphomicrobium sp.]
MVAISTTLVSGLSLLEMSRSVSDPGNALSFLQSDVFSASSKRIHDALIGTFAGSAGLKETYAATFEATFDRLSKYVTLLAGPEQANSEEQRITTLRNAAHNALVDTIMTNRGSFPPEGFTIRTEYPGGAWGTTEIPPGRTTPPGWRTTVESLDAAIAERSPAGRTPNPAVSVGTAGWRAAQALAGAAALGTDSAAVKVLEAMLEANQTARERTEALYHTT